MPTKLSDIDPNVRSQISLKCSIRKTYQTNTNRKEPLANSGSEMSKSTNMKFIFSYNKCMQNEKTQTNEIDEETYVKKIVAR